MSSKLVILVFKKKGHGSLLCKIMAFSQKHNMFSFDANWA